MFFEEELIVAELQHYIFSQYEINLAITFKDISFRGLSKIGSHTALIDVSKSIIFVFFGTQPESTCACATSL